MFVNFFKTLLKVFLKVRMHRYFESVLNVFLGVVTSFNSNFLVNSNTDHEWSNCLHHIRINTLVMKRTVFTTVIRQLCQWWHLALWTSSLSWLIASSWRSLCRHLRWQEQELGEPSRLWLHAANETNGKLFTIQAQETSNMRFWLRTAGIPTYFFLNLSLYYDYLWAALSTGCVLLVLCKLCSTAYYSQFTMSKRLFLPVDS